MRSSYVLVKAGGPLDREYSYISCMCVGEAWRKKGVATSLMRAAERVSRSWGFRWVALHVYESNASAVTLYQRCGYTVVDDDCSQPMEVIQGKKRLLMTKRM